MKKICLFILFAVVTLTLTGCTEKNVVGSLDEIMTKVYADIKEEEKPMMLTNTIVIEDNIEYYLGTKDIEYQEALASESGTGSIAHSVVLVRTKNTKQIEKTKEKIKNSVDPRKWICVGVAEENVVVESKGNLIILIMVEDETIREKIKENFKNL